MQQTQIIKIDSFSGGRTNFLDQTTIDPSMCASGSQNVWSPFGILTKMPGLTLLSTITASAGNYVNFITYNENISTSNNVYMGIGNYLFASNASAMAQLPVPIAYTVGSVSISGANLISATGNGTSWLTNATSTAALGKIRFQVVSGNSSVWANVKSVEDNTHLTLATAWANAVPTGSSYRIQQQANNNIPVTTYLSHAAINGELVFSGYGSNMVVYDGSNTLIVTAGPGLAFLDVFQGYVFGANASGFQSRLYWSSLNDPQTWPANNFIDIDLHNNGPVNGVKAFGQELIVFKHTGMYKVVGNVFDPTNPTYYVQKISTPSDFVFAASWSPTIHNMTNPSISYGASINYSTDVMIFYGGGHIYAYRQGTTFITRLSDKIVNDITNGTSPSNNYDIIQESAITGLSSNGYFLLAGMLPQMSASGQTLGQNAYHGQLMLMDRNGSWWLAYNDTLTATAGNICNDPFAQGCSMAVIPQIANPTTVVISAPSANSGIYLYTMNLIGPKFTTTYPDPDNAPYKDSYINSIWTSKEFNIEYGTFWKAVVYMQKQSGGAGAANLNMNWSIDQGSVTASAALDMTTGRGTVIRSVVPINQKGSTIQLTLSNTTSSQTFGVYAIKIYYTPSDEERIA